jgi:hypothetical protein
MKVAEALLNPLGEDDDDLECNYVIDKNLIVIEGNYSKLIKYLDWNDFGGIGWKKGTGTKPGCVLGK